MLLLNMFILYVTLQPEVGYNLGQILGGGRETGALASSKGHNLHSLATQMFTI